MQSKMATSCTNRDKFRGARVLLVDDCTDFVILMQHFLQTLEVCLDVAGDASSALKMASLGTYDLMLVDLVLPQVDGFEFIRRVREAGYSGPALIMSAHVLAQKDAAFIASGANDFLLKPMQLSRLEAVLASYL